MLKFSYKILDEPRSYIFSRLYSVRIFFIEFSKKASESFDGKKSLELSLGCKYINSFLGGLNPTGSLEKKLRQDKLPVSFPSQKNC